MLLVLQLVALWLLPPATAYDMIPRWGHAATYIPAPPSLLIHGGKTDPTSGFTYSTSPNSADLILLSLDSAWSTDSPPYSLLSTSSPSSGPAYSWHTSSLLSASSTGTEVLIFGGDPGSSSPNPTGADSAWSLSLGGANASWTHQANAWDSQPTRRRYLSSTSRDGSVWITGGQAPDGSGTVYREVYRFNPSSGFIPAPPLPVGLFHHMSFMLPNGTLIVLGGAYMSPNTGMAATPPLDRMYVLDTNSPSAAWITRSIAGLLPDGRRGASGVLIGEDRIWVFGGADARLGTVLGDAWMLDLRSLEWSEVKAAGAPSARYDQTAVVGPSGQIVVFGGFGENGPADAGTYIFDPSLSAWVTSYNPSASPASPSASAPAGSATISGTSASANGGTRTDSLGQTITDTNSSAPSSTTSVDPLAGFNRGLSPSVQVAIVLGCLAFVGSLVVLALWLCRRSKQRTTQEAAQSWDAERRGMIESRGLAKPYHLNEKRSGSRWSSPPEAQEDLPPSPPGKEKYGVIGLGMGAIGAGIQGFSRAANRVMSNPRQEYTALHDEGPSMGGGAMSPRKDGPTIRLIGPRAMPDGPPRAMSPRVNMLAEEDVRSFAAIPEESEPPSASSRCGSSRPSNELLRQDSGDRAADPFEDEPLIPPPRLRGGPVPTPNDSRADLSPFADTSFDITDVSTDSQPVAMSGSRYRLPSLTRSDPLDLAGLLVPRLGEDGDVSLGRSHRSSTYTNVSSDGEEGIVLHAQAASNQRAALLSSPSAAPTQETDTDGVISPVPDVYAPIKRTDTFFKRMTAGGITGLLGRSDSAQSRHRSPPIRDPADPPTLWTFGNDSDRGHGEAEDDLPRPPRLGHTRESVSISSLQSAKSMRDMVIIQRQESASSIESQAIVEQVTGSTVESRAPTPPTVLPSPSTTSPLNTLGRLRPTPSAPASASSSKTTSTARSDPPLPPAGSPLPAHLVSHRRPVKDMVFSINKRSSRVFTDASTSTPAVEAAVLSPESEYSPSTTPRPDRPGTMYETARRSPLTIANPDAGRSSS